MMDLSIHSQYTSLVGWNQVLVSNTYFSLEGLHVLIYDTTLWTYFDPPKLSQYVLPEHEQHSLSVHSANTPKQD
jgi:hypothetical protein